MKQMIFLLLAVIFFDTSCAKKAVTPAKVQLRVAGITATANSPGSGGRILFGRSKTGESFAQVISSAEETIELANGDWSFSALMWNDETSKMGGTVYCGNSTSQTLNGTDLTVSLNLSNSSCSDSIFSSAQIYTDANSKIHFSDVFLEECDEISANSFTCGLGKQGSARSYKFVFSSYKKSSGGGLSVGSSQLASACISADRSSGIISNAFPINIPGGTGSLAIPLELRMYLGSDSCDDADPKGFIKVSLDQGIASQATSNSNLSTSVVNYNPNNCSISTAAITGATPAENREKCESFLGQMGSTGFCNLSSIPESVTRFAPSAFCVAPAPVVVTPGNPSTTPSSPPVYPAIKHMVAISKSNLCAPYNNQSRTIGNNPFAGGNGTKERPYKICTEWQLNQIGEPSAPATFASSSYKLMNDLDMNLVDIGGKDGPNPIYTKPTCAYGSSRTGSSDLDNYHNLNSLDRLVDSNCSQIPLSDPSFLGFSGTFDGNNKSISNARIFGRNVDGVGFVRKLNSGGVIKNLKFDFLMSQGKSLVGGVAGLVLGGNAEIRNLTLDRVNVSAEDHNNSSSMGSVIFNSFVGGIAAKANINSFINNVQVKGKVSGGDFVGGLFGVLDGKVDHSSFVGTVNQGQAHGSNASGLVAYLSGEINNSFSEGFIEGDSRHIGGLVGYSNAGVINHSYSNMFITLNNKYPNYPNTKDYYTGGLIGYSDNGIFSDVYFGGLISFIYDNSTAKAGVVANGIIGGTGNNVNFSNCVTNYPTTGVQNSTGCSSLQGTDPLENGAISTLLAAAYTQKTGSLPRLSWEQRPCSLDENQRSVAIQASNGRGALNNPITICNANQLSQIAGRTNTLEHFLISDNISLRSWNSSSFIPNLYGSIHGNNKVLYALTAVAPADYQGTQYYIANFYSLIGTIEPSGMVDNLKISNVYLKSSNTSSVARAAVLAATNKGIIAGVDIKDATIYSQATNSGMIAAYNEKTITQSSLMRVQLNASRQAGLVSGESTSNSSITLVDADGSVRLLPINATPIFGGIVGYQVGAIDQVRFRGEVDTTSLTSTTNSPSSSAGRMAGGIAAYNMGSISNALVESWSRIKFNQTQYVGGIAGVNNGVISKSLNLALVSSFDFSASNPFYFGPLIGMNSNGQINNSFFIENMTGTFMGNPTSSTLASPTVTTANNVTTCESQYSSAISYLMPTIPGQAPNSVIANPDAADLFYLENGFGNRDSLNMNTITMLIAPQSGGSIFKYDSFNNGQCVASGSNVNFYKKLDLSASDLPRKLTASDLVDISKFTQFNISGKDSSGNRIKETELIGYFKSLMYQQPAPAVTPVWQIDGDPYPTLLQLQKL